MRSKFEHKVKDDLISRGIEFEYEPYSFEYDEPVRKGTCGECGSNNVLKGRWYTPDFRIKRRGTVTNQRSRCLRDSGSVSNAACRPDFYIEAKGLFTADNRKTLLLCRDQHEELRDIKLVFMRNNKIHKKSDMKYSDWCEKHGFEYCIGPSIPEEWL